MPKEIPSITIHNPEYKKDIMNIGLGVYAPLTGFLKKDDFQSVLKNMRLKNGAVWPIPIVLDISLGQKEHIGQDSLVQLINTKGETLARLHDIEIYEYDLETWAQQVFGTLDKDHPGVESLYQLQPYLLGGRIELIQQDFDLFPEYHHTPEQIRQQFKAKGWKSVAAFQTRNVPHRGHEFLQTSALEKTDGLLIQPVIGEKKKDDFSDEQIVQTYETLIEYYHPKDRVTLSILPLKMRYAGPREALMHALIRRNYGCTHFIVGRDHAGVGHYYGPYESQAIFKLFDPQELGIEIMTFPEVVFSKTKQAPCFINDCSKEDQISFSGTKFRQQLASGETPPAYFIRPQVYQTLLQAKQKEKIHRPHPSCVIWFTGLSQSGKSTISMRLYDYLKTKRYETQRLDGDVLRKSLSKDLGFSKSDRDEHLRRVGYMAQELEEQGQIVLASFISPYTEQRDRLRRMTKHFIEIYVNTPLEICEARDTKGLYAKARSGEIPHFTGISDP
ncbi:MAG TPA: sulfate adenylyltransferase, partial [Candidatus Gracilibacteria bacterium]